MPSLKPKADDSQIIAGQRQKGRLYTGIREKSAIFWIAFFTVFATCLPYALGYAIAPAGTHSPALPTTSMITMSISRGSAGKRWKSSSRTLYNPAARRSAI